MANSAILVARSSGAGRIPGMADHPYQFITLLSAQRNNAVVERGLNLAQIAAYEYVENGGDGEPMITLILSGGGTQDYRGEDARHVHRLVRGRY